MAQRPVNEAQRKVLDWLAAGGAQDPPEPEMKISAAALKSRGLVRIRRPGGKWTAELTEDGRYYAEHGTYPSQPGPTTKRPQTTRRTVPAPPVARSHNQAPQQHPAATVAAAEDVPLQQVIRRPHPAIKEIRDRPGRLPKFARRRSLLIAHSLVTEALARGWTVTPVTGRVERDHWGSRSVRYDSRSLLLIDAGHAPVGVIFDEVTKRQPHLDTKEEAAKRAKGQYLYTPAYDYVGTGQLRLHLTQQDRKIQPSYTDTTRVPLEEKLPAVLDAISGASLQALHWAEERRRREQEVEARRKEEQRIQALREQYEVWEAALNDGADAWARHRMLSDYLRAIEQTAQAPVSFVEWARGFLDSTDPRLGLPDGPPPQWSHGERARSGRVTPKPRYAW